MSPKPARLSKSKIISGVQCLKKLWLEVNNPQVGEVSEAASQLMGSGARVGELARTQFANGILIAEDQSLKDALAQTQAVLQAKQYDAIYEATIQHEGVLIKADILTREADAYTLYEVKASGSVKAYHYNDVAVQTWVLQKAGLPIKASYLTHINTRFVYAEPGNYQGIFTHEDISEGIKESLSQVEDWVSACRKTLTGDEPSIEPGDQCSSPFSCQFVDYCVGETEIEYPISFLPRAGKLVDEFAEEGIEDIRHIPEGRLTNAKQVRARECTINGEPWVSTEASSLIKALPYPRYYLDFESVNPAIPIWLGTRPYQQVPFQWSCHIEQEDGSITHKGFLETKGEDPTKGFTKSLVETISEEGCVLVYNAAFENSVMREMAARFPEYAARLEQIIAQVFDLLKVARDHYYHRDMAGSWSIKAVLPCIAPHLNYNELDTVHHGGEAQLAYQELVHPDTSEERKKVLKDALEKYCELDTWAMVEIARFFEKQ